jgi:hypothetical protein
VPVWGFIEPLAGKQELVFLFNEVAIFKGGRAGPPICSLNPVPFRPDLRQKATAAPSAQADRRDDTVALINLC